MTAISIHGLESIAADLACANTTPFAPWSKKLAARFKRKSMKTVEQRRTSSRRSLSQLHEKAETIPGGEAVTNLAHSTCGPGASALIGVAASKFQDFLGGAVAGFQEEYKKVEHHKAPDPGPGPEAGNLSTSPGV